MTTDMEFATARYVGRPTRDNDSRSEAESGVYDFLDRTGVNYTTLCHPAAFTMEECEAVRRDIGAPVFKNLFLTNRQQTEFYLLMIPADKPFKTKYLSSQLGCARLSFASAEKMEELHPCVNTASVAMPLSDLLEKVIPATGHTHTWVDLLPE